MENCIFCKIANHQIPAQIEYEDDVIVAFRDLYPCAPIHILIIPKKHIVGASYITEEDMDIIGKIMITAKKLAQKNSIEESGYRLVTNSGPDVGQGIPHLHFHLLGGSKMSWP